VSTKGSTKVAEAYTARLSPPRSGEFRQTNTSTEPTHGRLIPTLWRISIFVWRIWGIWTLLLWRLWRIWGIWTLLLWRLWRIWGIWTLLLWRLWGIRRILSSVIISGPHRRHVRRV